MNKTITKKMIKDGLNKDCILLVSSESKFNYSSSGFNIVDLNLDEGEIMCKIGDWQFYFAGFEGESCTPKEYIDNTPIENIVDEIFEALESLWEDDEDNDEYMYYYFFLTEICGIKQEV